MTVRTLIFVQCLLVFALLEELVPCFTDLPCDSQSKLWLLLDVAVAEGVLVLRVVFVGVTVCRRSRFRQGRV